MSEKIVILGNGFDLRHYLPTKYDHLITILREIESFDLNSHSIVNFEELFGNLFKEKDEWFYEKVKNFYETAEINFDVEKLQNIQNRIKINNWFQYLKSVEDNKIETWIDFETEIERVLKLILSYFNQTSSGVYKYPLYNISRSSKDYFYFPHHESEDFINNHLQINILNFFKLFHLDIDRKIIVVSDDYILNIEGKIQYYKEKVFFDIVYKSLEEFTGIFNDYIVNIVNVMYPNFKEELKENFLIQNDKFLFSNVDKVFSFNYTQTINELYKFIDLERNNIQKLNTLFNKNTAQEFLHGKAIKDWDSLDDLKIVLGVDEIDNNLKNHKLFQFTKYFQKLHKGTDYQFLSDFIENIDVNVRARNEFYFWGHSLDTSDQKYISDIFEIVNKTESKIIIFYHSITGKADQLRNLLGIIDKFKIEKFMNNKKLVFMEATSDNLFKELT